MNPRSAFSPGVRAFSFLFLLAIAGTELPGATVTWIAPGSGNWNTAANWDTGAVPPTGSDVVIAGTGTYTVTLDAMVTVNSVMLGGNISGTQTLKVNAGTRLTLNATMTVEPTGVLLLTGGDVSGGTTTVNGKVQAQSGTFLNGVTTIAQPGSLTLDGSALGLNAHTLNNAGTVTQISGRLLFANDPTFNNQQTGVLEFRTNTDLSSSPGGRLNNAGTVRRTTGTGVFHFSGGQFNNSALVEVTTGTLRLTGGGTESGQFSISAGAVLDVQFGNFALNVGTSFTGAGLVNLSGSGPVFMIPSGATVNAQNFQMVAGRVEGGTLNISGTLGFNGGTMKGGITSLGSAATMTFGGSGVRVLDGHTLNNAGTAIFSGTERLFFVNNAIFNNLAAAVLELQTNTSFSYGGPGGTFSNAGTVRRLLATGRFAVESQVTFNNSGTVEVQSGKLELQGGGSIGGNVVIGAGTNLDFRFGTFTVAGATFSGAGTVNVNGGVVAMPGPAPITLSKLVMTDGGIEGAARLSITESMVWGSGFMGPGGETSIEPGATMDIRWVNACCKTLNQRTLNNRGTTTWTDDTYQIILQNSASFNNLPGGVFEIRGDSSMVGDNEMTTSFNNAGTMNKVAGTDLFSPTEFLNVNLSNTGTVAVRTGQIHISGNTVYRQTAGVTRLSSGARLVRFGPMPLDIQGGTLGGYGIIDGNLTVSGGQFGLPGVVDLITLNGNYTQTAGGTFVAELGGLLPGNQFDQIIIAGTATLAGTIDVRLINGFYPATGDAFKVLRFGSRSGAFSTTTGLNTGGDEALLPYYYPDGYELLMNIYPADLSLSGSVSPDPVNSGGDITYSLNIGNSGPLPATGVELTSRIPQGTTFVSATPSAGTCTTGPTIVCTVGTIPVNGNATASIVVRATQAGPISNLLGVVSNETDRFQANNSLTLFTSAIQSATDPYITAFNPTQILSGGRRTVTVVGQNLPTIGATVRLERGTRRIPEDPADVIGRVISSTSSSIQVEFDLTAAPYFDFWAVVVTHPDGRTASRDLLIVPSMVVAASERSGNLGFPIGFRRTTYIDMYNAGNEDGFVMVEIEPPPGIELQVKSADHATLWDSTTEEDPSRATVIAYLKKDQILKIPTAWRVPPENVVFMGDGRVSASAVRSIQQEPRPLVFNSDQEVIWKSLTGINGEGFEFVLYDALTDVSCKSLGQNVKFNLGPEAFFEAVRATVPQAINEGVFEPHDLYQRIGDYIGTRSRLGTPVDFAADIRHCIDEIKIRFQRTFERYGKQTADAWRERMRDGPFRNQLWERAALQTIREAQTADGKKFGEQLLRRGGFIDQLNVNACNPAPRTNNSSLGRVRGAWDPNDKTVNSVTPCQTAAAPSTQCLQYYSTPFEPIEFLIEFENKKEATDPATFVVITDVFDPNLDLSTLQVIATSHPAVFSMSGQTVTFRFDDIQLRPNVNPPEGEGYVRLRVHPVPGLPLGTVIQNQASIVFDFNPAILTPLISVLMTDDVDRDGVLDFIEDRAPASGDGNADGTPDRLQAHVTSLTASGNALTLVTAGGCTQNQNVTAAIEQGQTKTDPLFEYTRGVLSFALPCTTAEVTLIHHGLSSLGTLPYRFLTPSDPTNPASLEWMTPGPVTVGVISVGGAPAATVTLTLNDFALGDQTDADGRIVHTGGLGAPTSTIEFFLGGLLVYEGRGTATIRVTRTGNSSGAASVAFSTTDGTATAADYVSASGTLSWLDGDLNPKTFTISITSDGTVEPDETIHLQLASPTGGAELGPARELMLTITDRLIGDINGDGSISVADIMYLINYLFAAGPAPLGNADTNSDGDVGVADIFYLISHLFSGGPAPG